MQAGINLKKARKTMKALLLTLSLALSFQLSAQQLRPAMLEMGDLFKNIAKAASEMKSDEETLKQLERLQEILTEAKEILPDQLDPQDEARVDQYKGLMSELLLLNQDLTKVFLSQPFNKALALKIIAQMGAVRKKGHELFR